MSAEAKMALEFGFQALLGVIIYVAWVPIVWNACKLWDRFNKGERK